MKIYNFRSKLGLNLVCFDVAQAGAVAALSNMDETTGKHTRTITRNHTRPNNDHTQDQALRDVSDGVLVLAALVTHYMGNAKIIRECFTELGFEIFGGTDAPYVFVNFPGRDSWDVFKEIMEKVRLPVPPPLFDSFRMLRKVDRSAEKSTGNSYATSWHILALSRHFPARDSSAFWRVFAPLLAEFRSNLSQVQVVTTPGSGFGPSGQVRSPSLPPPCPASALPPQIYRSSRRVFAKLVKTSQIDRGVRFVRFVRCLILLSGTACLNGCDWFGL